MIYQEKYEATKYDADCALDTVNHLQCIARRLFVLSAMHTTFLGLLCSTVSANCPRNDRLSS